jgi:hypothetical protein
MHGEVVTRLTKEEKVQARVKILKNFANQLSSPSDSKRVPYHEVLAI